jgi:hypothetical protein
MANGGIIGPVVTISTESQSRINYFHSHHQEVLQQSPNGQEH